jgi:TolB-like protein/Tfp pilus assembly protein PilF
MSLLVELQRRNVFRVATFYVVAGWILLQAGDLLFDVLGVPPWGLKLLLGLLVLGLPFVLVFSWVYELTPEGLKREHEVHPDASITAQTAGKLNFLIVGLLVVAIGLGIANWYGHRAGRGLEPGATTTQPTSRTNTPASARGGPTMPGGVGAATVSIAVLPFLNMSDDKANEYFSDGLTEELLNVLANVPGLRVIARTSSFAYKGKDVKIADVARDLSVDHVLEGSVRKSGDKVRITTQLIRASDSSHLWSDSYDRNLDDIFAVQDEISKQVVDALKLRLLSNGGAPSDIGGTRNPQAYEAFLLGRHFLSQGEVERSLRAALAAFEKAIDLDPAYAQAYAGKAGTLSRLASNAYIPFDVGFEQCRQAAIRSLELAPDLAEGHLALGQVQTIVDGNVGTTAASAERALQLNPGSELVQRLYSQSMSTLGEHDAAIAAAQAAVTLDPISADAHVNLANVLGSARRYPEAEAAARRALALAPDRGGAQAALGWVLLLQGRNDEASAAFEAESVIWGRLTGRALVLTRTGKADEARRELAAFQSRYGDNASYQYAQIEAQLGDNDAAMRWLENARRVHDPGLVGTAYVDPLLDPLRGDPRFEKLLHELGFVK